MAGPSSTPHAQNGYQPKPVWVYPLMTVFLWSVALFLAYWFFSAFKLIVLGLIGACSVAAMLRPLARRIPGPRGLSASIVGLGFFALVLGMLFMASWLLVSPISAQLKNWPQLEEKLNVLLSDWSARLGAARPVEVGTLGNQLSDLVTGQGLAGVVSQTTDILAILVVAAMFVFIGSIYILAEKPGRLMSPILKMLPPRRVASAKLVVQALEPRLRWWLIGTFIGMIAVGLASWLGYTLVGLQWALPLAVFAGITEAVPTVGPAVTFLLALLLAATQGVGQVVGVAAVYAAVQTLESYLLIPLVMRSAVDLPPIVTLFTIVLWGKIFGLAGLLLAVPIDLVIWTMIDLFVIRPDDVAAKPPP